MTKATIVWHLALLGCLCSPVVQAQSDEQAEAEVMAVLDEFIATFSASDPVAHTGTYHFPHYRLAGGHMSFWETREAAIARHEEIFAQLPATGWDHSEWVQRRVDIVAANKAHVHTQFRRVRADGSTIGVWDSLYILIRKDGRWGIKMRSSFLR